MKRPQFSITKHVTLTLLAPLAIAVLIAGCTANQRARQFGGTETINVAPGQKVVNATWKQDHLWVLTRPARPGEAPETLTFSEKSSFGLVEGTVVFVESK